MKTFSILVLLLGNSFFIYAQLKLKVKKLECTVDKDFIQVHECFVQPLENSYVFNFNVTFIKEVKALLINGIVNYKYSTPRPLTKFNFNFCNKLKLRSPLEKVVFDEFAAGFRLPDINKLCPVKPGQVYYGKKTEFDDSKLPQFLPTGEFFITVNYTNGKNYTLLQLVISVSLKKINN